MIDDNDNNGFPSGPHYNLNIIGKKAEFACNPVPDADPLTGLPVYGNVVFVPEFGSDSQIYIISGKGKTASTFTELKAIDPCAGFDGSPAQIQLPPNAAGYRVYARALAKPTDGSSPTMTLTPGLAFVEDETATDLVYVGLVTSSGFSSPYQNMTRTKGKSTAVDIGQLFMWAGTVCYQNQPVDEYGNPLPGYNQDTSKCWIDTNLNGIYDYGDSLVDPVNGACSEGTLLSLFCITYTTPEWVFNIADLVHYFWDVDTNGSKLVQIRFYPN
jgi:hypothetical protein